MPSPPTTFIALALRLDALSLLLRRHGNAVFETQVGVGMYEVRILRLVQQHVGISPGELVGLTGLEKTSVSKLLTKLVNSGHLSRSVGKESGRSVNAHLTELGEQVVDKTAAISQEMQKTYLSCLSPQEGAMLLGSIEKLTDWIKENVSKPSQFPTSP